MSKKVLTQRPTSVHPFLLWKGLPLWLEALCASYVYPIVVVSLRLGDGRVAPVLQLPVNSGNRPVEHHWVRWVPGVSQGLMSDRNDDTTTYTYVAGQCPMLGIDYTRHTRLVDNHDLVGIDIGLLKSITNFFDALEFEQTRFDGCLLGRKALSEGRRAG